MRIWVISDLHLDAAPWSMSAPEHDVLVIAGDVTSGAVPAARELDRIQTSTKKPIVFVPGNHDLLDSTLRPSELKGLSSPIAVLQQGNSIEIEGVRFIGATLWTDFELDQWGVTAQTWAISSMPEYRGVKHATEDRHITPRDVGLEHDQDLLGIERALSSPYAGATIVVTHHAPSGRSVPADDRRHERWPAYASDLEPLIKRYQPDLWIHGHIHEPQDYMLGKTRILSNPRGYPGWWDQGQPWQPELVVDL